MNTPLQRDAIKHDSIAHAEDVSCLIVDWARALVLGEDFYPMEHCKRYHDHWAKLDGAQLAAHTAFTSQHLLLPEPMPLDFTRELIRKT